MPIAEAQRGTSILLTVHHTKSSDLLDTSHAVKWMVDLPQHFTLLRSLV